MSQADVHFSMQIRLMKFAVTVDLAKDSGQAP